MTFERKNIFLNQVQQNEITHERKTKSKNVLLSSKTAFFIGQELEQLQ